MTAPPDLSGWLLAYAAPAEGSALAARGAVELGVGKAAAAAAATQLLLQRRPAGLLLFGVCGAFPSRHRGDVGDEAAGLGVGALCLVGRDRFGDEGALAPDGFRDLHALGLQEPAQASFVADPVTARLAARLEALGRPVAVVDGVTVSTCSGTDAASAAMARRSGAAVETMEGAAVALACRRLGVPFAQLRAVSNLTGDRDRAGWDLPRAVAAVQQALCALLDRGAAATP